MFIIKLHKKDINAGLLFLIIFLLILFAVFNAYYQRIIHGLSKDLDRNQEKLTEITAKLVLEETKTKSVSQSEEMAKKDMEFLEKDYNKLKNDLKKEKDITEQRTGDKESIGECKAVGSAACPD